MSANGLRGWTVDDLLFFLECHNFHLFKRFAGSHDNWINLYTKNITNVHILHKNSAYSPLTLSSMIQNMGYDDDYAQKWRSLNKSEQKKIAKKIKVEQM